MSQNAQFFFLSLFFAFLSLFPVTFGPVGLIKRTVQQDFSESAYIFGKHLFINLARYTCPLSSLLAIIKFA